MNIKKVIAGITALALTASASCISVCAENEPPIIEEEVSPDILSATTGTYGDLYYSISNNKVTITDCSSSAVSVLKIKPCKRNNRQNSDHTKDAAKEGNAEERPDAGCGIKR